MNELRRMAYLDALGIDSYISRVQLPGAAVTRRLAIVATPANAAPEKGALITPDTMSSAQDAVVPGPREGFERPDFGLNVRPPHAVVEPLRQPSPAASDPVPRFTLSAIIAGDWLWLEELDGMPLTTDQVQLVQSMAQALVLARGNDDSARPAAGAQAARPDVAQFDWPLHTNRQFDLGEEAARASVAGFIGRRLEQRGCLGLVILGQAGVKRVPLPEVKVVTATTASSAEILVNPALKRQVWQDLQPLLRTP